jgi:hypothetical protein
MGFEPAIQCTSDQGPRLRPRGHWIGSSITYLENYSIFKKDLVSIDT